MLTVCNEMLQLKLVLHPRWNVTVVQLTLRSKSVQCHLSCISPNDCINIRHYSFSWTDGSRLHHVSLSQVHVVYRCFLTI